MYTKYGVTGNALGQINDKFLDFTLPSHPHSFDMVARKGMRSGTIAVNHSEGNKHVGACNIL